MNALHRKLVMSAMLTAGIAVAGCTTAPYGHGDRYHRDYQAQQGQYGSRDVGCQVCGVVQDVQRVSTGGSGNGGTLGAIIGAVAGGVLGNQVGKGDGRKAATVVGAVAGGVVGNQIGKRGDERAAWRIVVRLDNGQYATVTQREDPGVQNGDYVEVRDGHVYPH